MFWKFTFHYPITAPYYALLLVTAVLRVSLTPSVQPTFATAGYVCFRSPIGGGQGEMEGTGGAGT